MQFGNTITLQPRSGFPATGSQSTAKYFNDYVQSLAVGMATKGADNVIDTPEERKAYEQALLLIANKGQKPTSNIDYSINANELAGFEYLHLMYSVGLLDKMDEWTPQQTADFKKAYVDRLNGIPNNTNIPGTNSNISSATSTLDYLYAGNQNAQNAALANVDLAFEVYRKLAENDKTVFNNSPVKSTSLSSLAVMTAINTTGNAVMTNLDEIVKAEPYQW